MKLILLLSLVNLFADELSAQEDYVVEFHSAVANWDRALADSPEDVDKLLDLREKLLAARAMIPEEQISNSLNRELANSTRVVVAGLVQSERFDKAYGLIREHYEFCKVNGVSVAGRSRESLRQFIEVHAMIYIATKADPLQSAELPYDLAQQNDSFVAVSIWGGASRVADVDGIFLTDLPDDETLGDYYDLGKKGKILKITVASFSFPGFGEKQIARLRSFYSAVQSPIAEPTRYVRLERPPEELDR